MKISISGASSLSLSTSVFFLKTEVWVGLLPITIFVEPLTLAYSAICVAASSPYSLVTFALSRWASRKFS